MTAPTPSGGGDAAREGPTDVEFLRVIAEAFDEGCRGYRTIAHDPNDNAYRAADRLREIAAALLAARRGEQDEAWSAYRRGYLDGTAYKPPEGSRDTFETLSAVADARASQHVKRRRAALAAAPEEK